ncbi:hypothetical protein ACHAWF_000796 [Thalassiosira exigua]
MNEVVPSSLERPRWWDASQYTPEGDCLDAPAFIGQVASASEDETLLPLLRGTVDDVVPREEIDTFVDSFLAEAFASASGYDENDGRRRDGRAYHDPKGYAGLGLRDLSATDEVRYAEPLKLREASRRATERTSSTLASTSTLQSSDCPSPVGGVCLEGGGGNGNDGNCPTPLHSSDESRHPPRTRPSSRCSVGPSTTSFLRKTSSRATTRTTGDAETGGRTMLDLCELSASDEVRYAELLELHEASRRATKRTLGLYPGTLFVEYTTAERTHYFDGNGRGGARARCNPSREHPYSHRVGTSILYLNDGDSGNFAEGEYYFGTPDGEVGRKVPVERGTMVCFTGGLEGLHSVLPVKRRTEGGADSDKEPCRLALAPKRPSAATPPHRGRIAGMAGVSLPISPQLRMTGIYSWCCPQRYYDGHHRSA